MKLDAIKFINFISLIVGCYIVGNVIGNQTFGLGLFLILYPFINNHKSEN